MSVRVTRTMVPESRAFATVVLCAALLITAGCAGHSVASVTLGDESLRVYVATTPEQLGTGLQGFDELAPGEGMLFAYPDAEPRTFAMRDVSFPIDVVFIGEDGTVSAVSALDPDDTRLAVSPGPCRYVLELPQGWAADNGIGVGSAFARSDD